MRIPKINELLQHIAKTKPAQKFYKWCSDGPEREKALNIFVPCAETIASSASYVLAVESLPESKMDRERKDLMNFQTLASAAIGLGLGVVANKWVYKQGEKIIKDLDPKKLDPKALRQISSGIRIISPAVMTASIMRFGLPVLTSFLSKPYIEKKKQAREKKLDIKA
jgi:hypothetical protein